MCEDLGLSKEHNYCTYSTFEPRFSMCWDFPKISLLGLGFRQKIGWEMGFGQNFRWEMGFVPPPPPSGPSVSASCYESTL